MTNEHGHSGAVFAAIAEASRLPLHKNCRPVVYSGTLTMTGGTHTGILYQRNELQVGDAPVIETYPENIRDARIVWVAEVER